MRLSAFVLALVVPVITTSERLPIGATAVVESSIGTLLAQQDSYSKLHKSSGSVQFCYAPVSQPNCSCVKFKDDGNGHLIDGDCVPDSYCTSNVDPC